MKLQHAPPPPPHARGYKVQSAEEKAASAKAAAQLPKERARRLAQMPHPPLSPARAPARVDRGCSRCTGCQQGTAGVESRRQCNAELAEREQEIEQQ